jgi:hypothetical protein
MEYVVLGGGRGPPPPHPPYTSYSGSRAVVGDQEYSRIAVDTTNPRL